MSSASERRSAAAGRRLADRWHELSTRQRQVLDLVASGASNKEIAARLAMSQQAVKQHVSRLLASFDLESRAGLAELAVGMRIAGQRASDLPLEYLFDRAPMAMAISRGPEHVFRAVNRAFVELFGDRRGWIGLPLRDLLGPLEAPLIPLVDGVYRGGATLRHESVPVRWSVSGASVAQRTMTLMLTPTRDAAGAVSGLIFFAINATDEAAPGAGRRAG